MATCVQMFAVRGSAGISMVNGAPSFKYVDSSNTVSEQSLRCRVMAFNQDGSLFAWCNSEYVLVARTSDWRILHQISKPRTSSIDFSPKGTHLAIWEPYAVTKENPGGTNNLEIWNLQTKALMKGFIQKKHEHWKPRWSEDEILCARNVTNEVHCFHEGKFDTIATKLRLQGVEGFEVSSGPSPYCIAAYVPGTKGAPSCVRLYRHPNFDSQASLLANKSFFKADKVNILWNRKGTGVLIVTSTDVDKSGASYYGEQTLHYIGVDGESSMVPLAKRGPIYSAQWNPNSKEFCAVYGFMPAKATLFNLKCEAIFDFGTGPRNEIMYNPQGNILCLAGFGNLRGNMEFWSRKDLKLISKPQSADSLLHIRDTQTTRDGIYISISSACKAPDSTFFQWGPDGQHIVTATCSPRLREGNGYKIWHYTGSLLHETSVKELWEVSWKPVPEGTFPEQPVAYQAVPSIASEQAKPKVAAYRPPQARGTVSSIKLHEEEPPQNLLNKNQELSKSAAKNKKKREAKARSKQGQSEAGQTPCYSADLSTRSTPTVVAGDASLQPDKEKKLRNLRKKLRQIEELKEQQKAGKALEKNQLEKLKTEASIVEQIKELDIQS